MNACRALSLQWIENRALILNTNLMPAGTICDKQVECQLAGAPRETATSAWGDAIFRRYLF